MKTFGAREMCSATWKDFSLHRDQVERRKCTKEGIAQISRVIMSSNKNNTRSRAAGRLASANLLFQQMYTRLNILLYWPCSIEPEAETTVKEKPQKRQGAWTRAIGFCVCVWNLRRLSIYILHNPARHRRLNHAAGEKERNSSAAVYCVRFFLFPRWEWRGEKNKEYTIYPDIINILPFDWKLVILFFSFWHR